jgi:ecotin
MYKPMRPWSFTGMVLLAASALGVEPPALKAFPAARDGMERFVVALPHKERAQEEAFRVEIIAGRQMSTDGVNQYRLANSIEARTLTGWGYTYYEVTGQGAVISTRMAAPPGAATVSAFVTAAPLLIRYNSRVPIVVYAPKGYEVRYRIWTAGPVMSSAQQQ